MNSFWIIFIVTLSALFILLTILAFSKWRDLSRMRNLHDLVGWSFTGGDGLSLCAEITNAQIELSIPQKYCIVEADIKYVKEILEEYRKDLVHCYFSGKPISVRSKYYISGADYFVFTLHNFLEKHECDYEFIGHDMHDETLEYRRFGYWGGPCCDATYALTDFGIVYHKMYYITYLYCKNSKITNPTGLSFQSEKFIKEILDTRQIKVSRL